MELHLLEKLLKSDISASIFCAIIQVGEKLSRLDSGDIACLAGKKTVLIETPDYRIAFPEGAQVQGKRTES